MVALNRWGGEAMLVLPMVVVVAVVVVVMVAAVGHWTHFSGMGMRLMVCVHVIWRWHFLFLCNKQNQKGIFSLQLSSLPHSFFFLQWISLGAYEGERWW